VKYCCLFLFVLILGIKINKDWDRSFKTNMQPALTNDLASVIKPKSILKTAFNQTNKQN